MPNLPGSVAAPSALGLAVAKTVILFYSVEALSTGLRERWSAVVLGGLVFLVGVAVRS